jgi:tetratricopeptide (TPR) repeat protein
MIKVRFRPEWVLLMCCVLPLSARPQSDDDAAAQLAQQGRQALAEGRMADAQSDFEKLSRLEPSIAEVHATLAAICFKRKNYEEALSEAKTAQKLKPTLPRLDSLVGLSLSELGRFNEALPKLEKGFKESSDVLNRRLCGLQLLRAYTGLGRDADAVETALALNRLYPDDPEVLYHTGRIYGNYAYITMEKLHDKAPNSVWMLQAQGEANESQKNYDAAIVAFNHVLELDPNRPGIHYRLGRVYLGRFRDEQKPEDRDSAIREFKAELSIDPRNGNAAYEIANQEALSGNLEQAKADYEQVVKRYPDFEEALVGLAGVYLQSGKPADAVSLLETATKLRPEDQVAWYRLAQAERATGNRAAQETAMTEFKKLRNASPSFPKAESDRNEITPQQLGEAAEQ